MLNRKTIAEKISKFHAWQKQPPRMAKPSSELHHCVNCEQDFTGNFCPYCSQRAGTHRVTWDSLRQQVMLIWGLDSRSLPYTLWQLLLRPGYLVRDYISGRQQVSFPPVKMLFIITVMVVIIEHLFFPDAKAAKHQSELTLLNQFIQWEQNNPTWAILLNSSLFLLPTWVLFRYAPAYYKHTIPESFFVMVFLSVITQMLSPLKYIFPTFSLIVTSFYYFITYRQLFGYTIWGTIWRLVFTAISAFNLAIFFFVLSGLITGNADQIVIQHETSATQTGKIIGLIVVLLLLLLPMTLLLTIGHLIDRHKHKQK